MSFLFEPLQLGSVQIKNRFVHSATFEAMAAETGDVGERLINRYRQLAKGEVGLIIPGHMFVHPLGRASRHQTGIHDDGMIPGLTKLAEAVHQEGGKITFQLAHAGRQTAKAVIGQTPISPSSRGRDPVYLVKPREMDEDQIQEVIRAFGLAAGRAVEAGADGVQLHAAHGYLINQFLSPFFNHRKDEWGGSDGNRFRFLKEVIFEVRKAIPREMPILVKLNTHDYTQPEGITPELAKTYAEWLWDLKIDGLEVSCGTALYSFMNICRGDVPVKELVGGLPFWKRPAGKMIIGRMEGQFGFKEGYNIKTAKMIKPVLGAMPLFVVGGLRKVAQMQEVLEKGYADGISMSRPFIREPSIVKRIREAKTDGVTCISCNRCLAAITRGFPARCYVKGLPSS